MDDREIYGKTEDGREEMRTRGQHLSGALRNALLLVDGHRTVGQLRELLAGGKTPADALEQILGLGLIQLIEALPRPEEPASIAPTSVAETPAATPAPVPAAEPEAAPPPAPEKSGAATAAGKPSRFERLYNVMNEMVRDYLGLRGYFMQLKVEKCVDADQLLALQDELRMAIAKIHGDDIAAELVTRIQAAA